MVWIVMAAAGVARLQNGLIGGVLLAAGIVSTLRHLKSEVRTPGEPNKSR